MDKSNWIGWMELKYIIMEFFVDFEKLLHFLSFFSIFLVIAVLNYSMAVYRNLCE